MDNVEEQSNVASSPEMSIEAARKIIGAFKFKISGYPSDKDYVPLHDMSESMQRALGYCQLNIPRTEIQMIGKMEDSSDHPIIFVPGVTLIYGPSASGKTQLTKYIKEELSDVEWLRFHEPEIPGIVSVTLLIERIMKFLSSDREMMIIDSFRFFLYNSDSKAAAMSGGISSQFFTELTNLNVLAASLNKKLVIVANFLSESSKNEDVIKNAIAGSVGGYMRTFKQGNRLMFEYASRSNENMRTELYFVNPRFEAMTSTELLEKKDSVAKSVSDVDVGEDEEFLSAYRRLIFGGK